MKTWKTSRDPDCAAKRVRVEYVSAIVDGEVIPEVGEPEVAFCLDGFGPLSLQPHPGRQWAERSNRPQGSQPGAHSPAAGDLQPTARRPAPVRRVGPGQGREKISPEPRQLVHKPRNLSRAQASGPDTVAESTDTLVRTRRVQEGLISRPL
ncbi:hypothetical protein PV726_46215 [Streptomyces europaeiscabiei]|nr:hypothetical protein [Streptomyces europaeiscabiei]